MTLIRNVLAWIAVAAVIAVMAPIVALINIIVVIIAAPIAAFSLVAYAIEEGLSVRFSTGDRWFTLNNRLSTVIGIITGTPAIVMNLAIENVYCLIHS